MPRRNRNARHRHLEGRHHKPCEELVFAHTQIDGQHKVAISPRIEDPSKIDSWVQKILQEARQKVGM